MKSASFVTMAMMVLVAALCLISWNGFSDAWAKGAGGFHGTTSHITQPSNTQGSPSSSPGYSANSAKSSKGSKGTKDPYMQYNFKDTMISGY